MNTPQEVRPAPFTAHMMPGQGTDQDAERQCASISKALDQGVGEVSEQDEPTPKKSKTRIKFVVNVTKWRDTINGNTYHSVRITRTSDGAVLVGQYAPYEYGYGSQYKQTALSALAAAKWLPPKYRGKDENSACGFDRSMYYERENNYPIIWNVTLGLKRDMIANGTV